MGFAALRNEKTSLDALRAHLARPNIRRMRPDPVKVSQKVSQIARQAQRMLL
jgi:hypothetical protein